MQRLCNEFDGEAKNRLIDALSGISVVNNESNSKEEGTDDPFDMIDSSSATNILEEPLGLDTIAEDKDLL